MKKIVLSVFSTAAVLSLVTACGTTSTENNSGGTTPSNSAGTSGQKVNLTLWWPNAQGSTDPNSVNAYKVLALWNKENPNIQVTAVSMPYNQIQTKLTAAATAGNLPDVVQGLEEWVTQFNDMGILPNLTPDVNSWSSKSVIPQNIWDAVTVDGKVVAMPDYVNARGFLYHKDMFTKAGIQNPPTTWTQLIADGQKLKALGVIPFGIATDSARGPQELVSYLWQSGTDIVTKMSDGKYKNVWNQDPAQLADATATFQFYKTLLDDGLISKDEYNWSYQQEDQNFALGQVAMVQDGPWMQSYETQNPSTMKDVGLAPIPYNKQPATYLEVAPYFTFTKSPHEADAIKFMEFLDSKQVQTMANSSDSVRNDVSTPGLWGAGFKNLYSQGKSWPKVSLGTVEQNMSTAIQYVLLGQKTPQQTAQWLGNQINSDLQSDGQLSSSSTVATH